MTILGRHTVQEVLEYIKSQDFRFDKYNEAFKSITAGWRAANQHKATLLDRDWAAIYKKWKDLAFKTTLSLKAQMVAAGPLVSANMVPAESEWKEVTAIFDNGKEPGGQRDCEYRIEGALGHSVDVDTNRPLQKAPDIDVGAIKELDGAIKAGEAAATQAGKSAGQVAKSNVGLIVGGVLVVGLASGVALKVYL